MARLAGPLMARDTMSGASLGDRIGVAAGHVARMRGLLGRSGLLPGEGLLITPCSGIHTWFMRFGIDVAFLGKDGRIVAMRHCVPPFRFVPYVRGARQALELPCGTLERANVKIGDGVEFEAAQGSMA